MPHAARRINRPGAMLRAMRLLLKWLLSAAALLCVAYLYSGVEVRSFGAALIAALKTQGVPRPLSRGTPAAIWAVETTIWV